MRERDYYDRKLEESTYSMKSCGLCLFGIILFLMLSFLFSGCNDREYKRQIRELQARLAEAEEKVDTFIIRDSIPVWKEKVVEVDRTDYKKLLADKELIKDLKLKVSELESENRTLLSTRDTVVLDNKNDTIFTYSDKWSFFSYNVNSRVLDWEVRDSLSTFVSTQYRHRFLWWRWGRKGYNVTIVNHNPRSRVEYSKFIKIK